MSTTKTSGEVLFAKRSAMVNIIICDDDVVYTKRLKAAIESSMKSRGIQSKVYLFNDGEEIGGEVLKTCDIAFLDIDFAGKSYNGLDIAARLRELRKDAIIVFVTNYIEYAPAGYEVQAFRYIMKNELSEKLESGIDRIVEYLKKDRTIIKIQTNSEYMDISVQDILFVESLAHIVVFHVKTDTNYNEKTYSRYSSLSKVESELSQLGFLRIQKSFLVNMRYIKSFNCNEAVLKNGEVIKVSKKTYSDCKRQFMLWRGQN